MHSKVFPLVDQAGEFAERWKQLIERWSTAGLPDETAYSRLHGATFKEFSKRVMTTLDLVAALGRVDVRTYLMPYRCKLPNYLTLKSHAIFVTQMTN